MKDGEHYWKLYEERVARNVRFIQWLLVLFVVVVIEGFNHIDNTENFKRDYLFCVTSYAKAYRQPLYQFYGKKIRFSDTLASDDEKQKLISQGIVHRDNLPFFDSYLRSKGVVFLGSYSRKFFGYDVSYRLYLGSMFFAPTLILGCIFFNSYGLRKALEIAKTTSPELSPTIISVAFSRVLYIDNKGDEPSFKNHVRYFAIGTFFLSFLILLLTVICNNWLNVSGVMLLASNDRFYPTIDLHFREYSLLSEGRIVWTILILFLVNGRLSYNTFEVLTLPKSKWVNVSFILFDSKQSSDIRNLLPLESFESQETCDY